MKIECIKTSVGLIPVSDRESDKLVRFKNHDQYTIEIKEQRNYQFHKKVFAFFNYCFEFWVDDNNYRTERVSFDVFRDNLTVLAGYRDVYYKVDGSARVEAKSISYAAMSEDDFGEYYKALVQAAMDTIFKNCGDGEYDKLTGFF